MSDFTISISYDPGKHPKKPFQYVDENGECADLKQHCNGGQTIHWTLVKGAAHVTIEFPASKDGNPFAPSTRTFDADMGAPTADGTFNAADSHGSSYKYNVIVKDAKGNKIDSDDPEIAFDDGSDTLPTQFEARLFEGADTIATSAIKAWEAAVTQLTNLPTVKADPQRLFFPNGINDIEVDFEFGGAIVKITVKGPDAAALSGDEHTRT